MPVSVYLATSALLVGLAAWVVAVRPQDRVNRTLGALLLLFGGFALIFGPLRGGATAGDAARYAHLAVWYLLPAPFLLLLLVDQLFLGFPRRPWQRAALAAAGAVTVVGLSVQAFAPGLFSSPPVATPGGSWYAAPTELGNGLVAAVSFAEAFALVVAARAAVAPGRSALQRRQAALVGLAFGVLVADAAGSHLSSALRLPFALGEPGWIWAQGLAEALALGLAARPLLVAFQGSARSVAAAGLAVALLDGMLGLVAHAAALLDAPAIVREAAGRPVWQGIFAVTLAIAVLRYGLAGVAKGPRARAQAGAAAVLAVPVSAMAGVAVLDAAGTGAPALAAAALVVLLPFALVAAPLGLLEGPARRLLLDPDDPHVTGERAVRYAEALRATAVRTGGVPRASDPALRELRRELGLTEHDHQLVASVLHDPRAQAAPQAPLLGRYRVERELGRGAFGTALLATDTATGAKVVLKRFHAGWVEQRAFAEARAMTAVRHPRIVPLLAVERVGDEVFLVLAFAEGGSAQALLETEGPLPPPRAVALAQDILEGLGALHAGGLAHGDVKLANILLDKEGRALVADLGSARATARADLDHTLTTSPVLGSYATLAPEVLRGGRRSPQADLYAVGAVLYRLLTGRHYLELEGKDAVAAGEAILHEPPRLPARGVPHGLEPVLARALAKEPTHRFADAEEMRVALDQALRPRGRGLRARRGVPSGTPA